MCYPGFLSGPCRFALVGLRCLWVPRSCGVHGLRDEVTCLRSGLCSSSVLDRNEDFPSFWWVWFLALVRVLLPQAGAVFLACVSPSGYLSFSYVFLRDVVTLWVNSVFLSLLIANEGLHCWLFLFRYSHPYWGRVVVFIRPLLVCRIFWWLVATLFPGLSLFFASGLSSPGLLGCFALCLRYADFLYLWLCAHSLLAQGIRGHFACHLPSSLLWFC